MTRDPNLYLYQILEYAESIIEYAAAGEDEYYKSKMMRDAIIKNFMVIGEVAKRIPNVLKAELHAIEWSSFAKFRDVLIHGYDKTDYYTVWQVATTNVPEVIRVLQAYLPPRDQTKLEF